jgi:hypothetical protein
MEVRQLYHNVHCLLFTSFFEIGGADTVSLIILICGNLSDSFSTSHVDSSRSFVIFLSDNAVSGCTTQGAATNCGLCGHSASSQLSRQEIFALYRRFAPRGLAYSSYYAHGTIT